MLADGPYVDCFRHLWPDATGAFSYWSTRGGNQLLNEPQPQPQPYPNPSPNPTPTPTPTLPLPQP